MSAMPLARAVLTGAFLLGFAGSAFALDANDFARTLTTDLTKFGWTVTYNGAEASGDTVVLHNATVKVPSGALPIGDMSFSGVKSTNGGYTADKLTVPDINITKDGHALSVAGIEFDGLDIPAPTPGKEDIGFVRYKQMNIGPVNFSGPQGRLAAIGKINSQLQLEGNGKVYDSATSVTGITLYLDHAADPKAQKLNDTLGYHTVTGRVDVKGSWDTASGKLDIAQDSLQFDNVGKLNFTGEVDGYTPAFVKSLTQLTAKLRANPDDKKAQQAYGIAMLGLMQQLSLGGVSLGFTDDSLTRRVINYMAKQQQVSPAQIVQAAKAMLPLSLAKLNNPQFEQQITDAVGAFLDNPKNIEIKVAPANPVPVPMIMGAAMAAPQTLPDVLNITVTANQ